MKITKLTDLPEWLDRRFPLHDVNGTPKHGTYGLVWFLKQREHGENEFAVKTLDPEKAAKDNRVDLEYLVREFRTWLDLPYSWNVVPALSMDIVRVGGKPGESDFNLPLMVMAKMSGSLEEWMHDDRWDSVDRIIAGAQAFNGLIHIYANGIEGHGDIKPSNILFADLRERFELGDGPAWPSANRPWLIRIADLGWADAWKHFGFTNKALREYMAPERLGEKPHFLPQKSDVFSMGIVVAELMQRRHPARNLKKAKSSEGSWIRCVNQGDWNLDDVAPQSLRELIRACLSSSPELRPTPEECLAALCKILRESYDLAVSDTLRLWNEQPSQVENADRQSWAARQIATCNPEALAESIAQLKTQCAQVRVVDIESCRVWTILARQLVSLLERSGFGADDIQEVQSQAKINISRVLDGVNSNMLGSITMQKEIVGFVQPFEVFSAFVGNLVEVSGTTPSQFLSNSRLGTEFLQAALTFSLASEAHAAGSVPYSLLAECIRLAPDQSVPYYFRALWSWTDAIMGSTPEDHKRINADLERAIKLAPGWKEPVALLDELRGKS